MDTFLGIVVLAVIVGGMYLYQKGVSALGRKANQSVVMRGAHREGQGLVSQRLVFSANASTDEVRKAILSTVKVAPHVPPLIADAHLIQATDKFIVYGYGNKIDPQNFRGLLSFSATPNGTQGSWEIVDWTLEGGIVAGQSVMKRLVADINTALRSVDPSAALAVQAAGRVAA